MTLRFRLTFWYFIVSLTILLVFSFGTYLAMRHLLIRAIDQELFTITNSVALNYDPSIHTFRDFSTDTYNLNRYLKKFFLIVYDSTGKSIYHSPLAHKIGLDIPLSRENIAKEYTIEKRKEDIPTIDAPEYTATGETVAFRVISRKLFNNDHQIGWATLAIPIADIESSLHQLTYILLAGIFLTVILIGLGGYFLTHQSLLPINRITRQARNISHSKLGERIPIIHPKDELGQLTIVLNDLFERLQKAFESQKDFLSGAAHELKTPLSIIRAHWEGELNNPEITGEMKEKMVQDIETVTRLSHLINNLILLSQTEAIEENFEFSPVQLDFLLKDVVTDCQVLADMKSQQLQIVEIPQLEVTGDKNRLYQLFFNIIDNAIKYTPEKGKIWIRGMIQNSWVMIEVRDNGIGITEDNLPRIFDRFYRVQRDRARKTGGSGLGLSICKLIAEAHKGEIIVESSSGKGTAFVVKLPIFRPFSNKN
jgi:signal transduction histidine kinase